MEGTKDYSELERIIGYSFQDKSLLETALTHSSFANEMKINIKKDYERLEFLGDAVLELVSSDYIYHECKDMPEGQMTKKRASMVCEPALAYCAKDIELGSYIRLGKGEERTGGRQRESIISDVMEAVIGAMYLDGGYSVASTFINKFILNDLEDKMLFLDSKSILQEMIQAIGYESFEYVLTGAEGPDHDKIFSVNAVLNGEIVGSGSGRNKKTAEQKAAYEAISLLKRR